MTDLYQILGVSQQSSASEIRSAYRKLARQFHPDVSSSPDANARFTQINDAYHVLIDPQRRRAYDCGEDLESLKKVHVARAAEFAALKREFDRMFDEVIAQDRQEIAARRHAVLIVVPLFLSAFYVMVTAARLPILIDFGLLGGLLVVGLAVAGLVYLVKNLSLVLSHYTYKEPDQLITMLREETPQEKAISRKAGLVFLICGYLVSLGLGYMVSKTLPMKDVPSFSLGVLFNTLVYPPIAVLVIGSLRRIGKFLDPFRS